MDRSTVILLHGTDEYAIHNTLQGLMAGMGDPSTSSMNITRLDGRDFNQDAFLTAINSIPFLSNRRLVILNNPGQAYKSPGDHKKLFSLVDALPATTTLILVEYSYLIPQNNPKKTEHWLQKWARSTNGKVKVQACNLPDRRDLPVWILQETRRQAERNHAKVKIDLSAAQLLANMIGDEPRIAAQEIAKLLEYVNFERDLTSADVNQVSIVNAQEDVFALVDALGKKNGSRAQFVLHQLLENEDPFSLWGMVVRQFRLLLLVREMFENKASLEEIVHGLQLQYFVAQKLQDQARGFDLPGLEAIYHRLLELDEGMKTSQVTTGLALDLLLVEICN